MRPEETTKGVGVDGEERTNDLGLRQSNIKRSGTLKESGSNLPVTLEANQEERLHGKPGM